MFPKIPAKLKSGIYVTAGAVGMLTGINVVSGNEKFYDTILMPLLHKLLDPETSHNLAVLVSKYGLVPKCQYADTKPLKTQLWQLDFSNPVGIAAGFDKQGEAVKSLHKMGFGFVEVGSVTPLPQSGNNKPRVFRLDQDKAIINRYGFNSDGHNAVYERLKSLKADQQYSGIVGVNLGKNRHSEDPVNDYVEGIKKFGDVADYLVINISSPNTPGLRSWQSKQQLKELLTRLVATRDALPLSRRPPLLLKLAPDLSYNERQDIANVIKDKKCRVDGLVISNTTIGRALSLQSELAGQEGGLSGLPISNLSTQLIEDMYRLTEGKVFIIGVGGIFSGRDAYDKIRAGASLVQLYTSLAYHGPPIIGRIKKDLDDLIRADGLNSVAEAVGKGTKV